MKYVNKLLHEAKLEFLKSKLDHQKLKIINER